MLRHTLGAVAPGTCATGYMGNTNKTLEGVVANTAALLLPPGCEVSRSVQVSNDDHFTWAHPVEKAIVEHEKLAEIRLIQFGYDATALGELIE